MVAFLRANQQCEGACFAVKSVLDSALLAKSAVVVAAPSDPAKINGVLERVDVYDTTAPIAFNCVLWYATDLDTPSAHPLWTFASERVLAKPPANANHMILKLALRNSFDDKITVVWVDPTAHQVDPFGHSVKFVKDGELGDRGYANVSKAFKGYGHCFDLNGTEDLAPWIRTVGMVPLRLEVASNRGQLPFHVCAMLIDAWKDLVNELTFLKVPWMRVEDFLDQEQS